MIGAQAPVFVLLVLVAMEDNRKKCSKTQCSSSEFGLEGSQPRQEDHGSAGCQGSQPTQEEMAKEHGDADVEAGVAARPPLMFQYFETRCTKPFWQMVDDSYQELLSDCFCGSGNLTSSRDWLRTLDLTDKCATPGCFRSRQYPYPCDRDRCCLKGLHTGCREHLPECDQKFLHYHGWLWRRDPTDVIPLGPPTEYRLGRDVRKVSVTIVDKESQPLRDEHGYPYNLWWQYKDDRGWKNFDLEANEDILNLWQKPHERECWKEVLAWDGRRFQTTHVNPLKMTASFQDKRKLMRLVILEAYL